MENHLERNDSSDSPLFRGVREGTESENETPEREEEELYMEPEEPTVRHWGELHIIVHGRAIPVRLLKEDGGIDPATGQGTEEKRKKQGQTNEGGQE